MCVCVYVSTPDCASKEIITRLQMFQTDATGEGGEIDLPNPS